MAVIPADTDTLMTRLAEQLESLFCPLRLADAMRLCGSVHTILLADGPYEHAA